MLSISTCFAKCIKIVPKKYMFEVYKEWVLFIDKALSTEWKSEWLIDMMICVNRALSKVCASNQPNKQTNMTEYCFHQKVLTILRQR